VFLVVLILVFWAIWSRVRFLVVVPVSLPALIAISIGVAILLFLLVDHALSRILRR
jgi:hypothetical protein